MDIGCSRFPNNWFNNRNNNRFNNRNNNQFNNRPHQPWANAAQYDEDDTTQDEIHAAQTSQPCRPKGPCFNCGKMGHFTAECRGGTRVNYMDAYEGEDQICYRPWERQAAIDRRTSCKSRLTGAMGTVFVLEQQDRPALR